ncbi:MAG: adenylate/guanylate cyclase domain-containing protein [Myxococcota bacterium]|nr:adenylate/guanylate cyclase domain-containing protein [Myxococcota bacterium]
MTLEKPHILIVDDDLTICKLLRVALEKAGCEVSTLQHGALGLRAALNTSFSTIITDLAMPGMDGLELIEALRDLRIDVPILAVCSYAGFDKVIEAMRLGASDYIIKDHELATKVVHGVAKAQKYRLMSRENIELSQKLAQRNRELEAINEQNRRLSERLMLMNGDVSGMVDETGFELVQRLTGVSALSEVATGIGSVLELKQILRMTMQTSCEIMQAQGSSLILKEEDSDALRFYITSDEHADGLTEGMVKAGHGLVGWVSEYGKPAVVEDAYKDPRFDPDFDEKSGLRATSILCVPLEISSGIMGVAQVLNPIHKKAFDLKDLRTFTSFVRHASIAIHNAKLLEEAREVAGELRQALERERWLTLQRDKLGSYVPESVVEGIKSQREDALALPTRLISATIIFSDIKGFTRMVEGASPERIVGALNSYQSLMYEVVKKCGGILDKFVGDGIMIIFVPKNAADNEAARAVRCGIDMVDKVREFQEQWSSYGLGALAIRVGIQSGRVVSGSVGTSERRDFTVMGDVVNVASRLEGKAPDNGVVIGEGTFEKVEGSFRLQCLEPLQVKNRVDPVKCYQVNLS